MMRFVLFAMLLFPYPSLAADPPPLRLGGGEHSLASHFAYLEDRRGDLSVDDVLSPRLTERFQSVGSRDANFGYSRSVYWLRAELQPGGDSQRYYLEIAYPTLDRVTVFLVAADGSRQTASAGDLQQFSLRPFRHHNLVFPLVIPSKGSSVLLIRAESEGSLTIPATMWNETSFYHHSLNEYALLSLYFGILAALFLYNLFIYTQLRERVFLAYIGFVGSMALGQLSQCGFGNEFLWPSAPAWGNAAFPVGFALTGLFGALFTHYFLDTRRSVPRLDRVILLLAAGFAAASLSPLFLPYRLTAMFTSLLGVLFSVVAVAAGVVCLRRGNPGARFFLLAWTLLLVGVGMLGMRNLALIPTTFVTSYGMQIGSGLEMLLLSFALAERINQMRREKIAAQQDALAMADEKEAVLANKAREWEETFNSLSDMVIILDRQYRIIKANRAAAEFLGISPEHLTGMMCINLHHRVDCRPDTCPCHDTFVSGTAAVREFYEPRFDRWLEVSTSPIRDAAGNVTSAVHVTKDVTWRKKTEEALLRTEKLDSLAVLAGGIAHDFNNMLTIIMSTTTLAKMYARDDARVVAKITEAEEEIMRARDLTGQLLTFAKGGAPVKRLSSFPGLLRDTVEFSLRGSTVTGETVIAGDLWSAEIDRTQISQVISNLVINAAQAMPQGGTIYVSAMNTVIDRQGDIPLPPGRYVRLAVEDSGTGIAAEHLPRIFDPFFTTKAGGSGLGLSTSYSIVKKHGGYIDVQSHPGSGTLFTVYLPASEESCTLEPSAEARELKGNGRVLLMDDDEKLAASVAAVLEGIGYEVETARNGEEAIILYKRALAHGRPFGAVTLDVTVPAGMDGRECIRRLLELDPGVRAIVVSGYSKDAVLAEFAKCGFKEALPKPFTAAELHDALQRVMA